jgi:ribosomal RNA assembly protein
MEHILIPEKRAELLKGMRKNVEEALKCRIEIEEGNEIIIKGEAYDEYNAKNVIQAFGRGFEIGKAYKLLDDKYFFKFTNLKDFLRNEEQIRRIKARIIGVEGKTKLYIEEISGADLSIYGNTVGMIGTTEELGIASAALQVLLEGGTHKKAYNIMERMRRKLNQAT